VYGSQIIYNPGSSSQRFVSLVIYLISQSNVIILSCLALAENVHKVVHHCFNVNTQSPGAGIEDLTFSIASYTAF
jgi:hypothetical protein